MKKTLLAAATLAVGVGVALLPLAWSDTAASTATVLYLLWGAFPFFALASAQLRERGGTRTVLGFPIALAGTVLGQVGTIESDNPTLGLGLIVMPLLLAALVGSDLVPRLVGRRH